MVEEKSAKQEAKIWSGKRHQTASGNKIYPMFLARLSLNEKGQGESHISHRGRQKDSKSIQRNPFGKKSSLILDNGWKFQIFWEIKTTYWKKRCHFYNLPLEKISSQEREETAKNKKQKKSIKQKHCFRIKSRPSKWIKKFKFQCWKIIGNNTTENINEITKNNEKFNCLATSSTFGSQV